MVLNSNGQITSYDSSYSTSTSVNLDILLYAPHPKEHAAPPRTMPCAQPRTPCHRPAYTQQGVCISHHKPHTRLASYHGCLDQPPLHLATGARARSARTALRAVPSRRALSAPLRRTATRPRRSARHQQPVQSHMTTRRPHCGLNGVGAGCSYDGAG